MQRICVIFNPAARGEGARRFRDRLNVLAAQSSLRPTTCAGGARSLAAEAAKEGFDIVVAAGGDGTVNEVLNGIADTPDGLQRVRFAVLPLGTVNVFARELGMPRQLDLAWKVILDGHESRIDLPQVEFQTSTGTQRRYFAQMAGAGLDSMAVEQVNWAVKKRLGALAYVVAGLKVLRKPLPQITVSDGAMQSTGEMVVLGNGRFYGGSFQLFPLADLRDGLLEVTVFPKLRRPDWMARSLWGLACNRVYAVGGAKHLKARSLTLTSSVPVPFHVEGENVGWLPATFCMKDAALRVIVPKPA